MLESLKYSSLDKAFKAEDFRIPLSPTSTKHVSILQPGFITLATQEMNHLALISSIKFSAPIGTFALKTSVKNFNMRGC